jgi:hypothetical protein
VADLIESLIGIPGVVAVARAGGEDVARPAPPGAEPAYLLYYRGTLEAGDLRNLGFEGEVAKPGAWGRLMNGGASLTVEGGRVDVVYRDRDAVERWVAEASEGRFEIDAVDGWLAGMPTYVLVGELATCEALAGELPRPEFPAALREAATRRWRDAAASVLEIAESLASRGDVAGCVGLLAKAAVAAAQARLAERGEWAVSEGGIVRRAGLGRSEAILAATGDRPFDLERAVFRMRVALGLTAGGTTVPEAA